MVLKPHHLLLGLLATASVALDLFVVASSVEGSSLPLMMGLGFSQIGLLSAWLVWGRTNSVLRLVALLGAVFAWAHSLSSWNDQPPHQWMSVLLFYAAMVAAPLLAMRARGKRLTAPFLNDQSEEGLRRWQFSIWGLLCLMTAAAVLLSFGRLVSFPWQFAFEVAVLCGSFALVAFVALVAALQCHRGIVPLFASAVVCLLLGRGLAVLGGKANYTLIFAIQATLIMLSVAVVRVGQYRLENVNVLSSNWPASSMAQR